MHARDRIMLVYVGQTMQLHFSVSNLPSVAQKPSVNITTEDGTEAGNVQVTVPVGRSYEIACISTGAYKGRVTWMKKIGKSKYVCVDVNMQLP